MRFYRFLPLLTVAGLLAGPAADAAPIDNTAYSVPKYAVLPKQVPELNEAQTAYEDGDFGATLKHLQAAVDAQPNLPPAELMLARMHFSRKLSTAGRALLEKAAVKHRNHPEVYLLFGGLALAEGRMTDAWLHYRKAVDVGVPATWPSPQQRKVKIESLAGLALASEGAQGLGRCGPSAGRVGEPGPEKRQHPRSAGHRSVHGRGRPGGLSTVSKGGRTRQAAEPG